MSVFAGIDLGTSGVKTVLVDAAQRVIGDAHAALEVSRPHPGWSEQDPEAWWRAAEETLDALATRFPAEMAALSAIGLSGQMHGATLLDAADTVLRPAILWNDGRSAAECAELEARADFRGIGGNVVMPGFTAPKLEWVRRHEPEVFARVAKVLLPKDYLRLRLSGEHVSDLSDSAGTLWLDIAGRCWSPALLEATGLTLAQMPRLVEGSAPGGALRAELCARWGITGPAPVIAGGGGDNAASACGVGAVTAGTGFLSLGTSGVVFVATADAGANPGRAVHTFCHAVPHTWHQMGVTLSATDSLNWLSEITGQGPARLVELAAEQPFSSADPLFLPYLSGERTPWNDATARGAFTGLSRSTDIGALARAVLSGVAASLADCVQALTEGGTAPHLLYAVGGGARSTYWLQAIADAGQVTIALPGKGDFGAAIGAARLAICATGESIDAVMTRPVPEREITPRSDSFWPERLTRYREAWPDVAHA
ncbi:xylulokinase [Paroceanicella profunda]|uniref:Xylulose kinase n=1 Tax=Paroceanicella profunda TaxID=2579971 RepID=A0A5B8FW99_9RHOB|nr:xylulokinase [Paroceanicella profunda]QDL91734.1 xylulokinase [Paroceanicella profunda]